MFFLFESIPVIEALGFGDVKCALATHAYNRGGDHLPTAINDPGPCNLLRLGVLAYRRDAVSLIVLLVFYGFARNAVPALSALSDSSDLSWHRVVDKYLTDADCGETINVWFYDDCRAVKLF